MGGINDPELEKKKKYRRNKRINNSKNECI